MLVFLRRSGPRLAILTLLHFSVDFYGGLTVPLSEPTLTEHLDVTLPMIALLVGGCAMVINLIQPVSGILLPSHGMPYLLIAAPLAAGLTACIGLSHSYWTVGAMLLVAGIGIGMVHPEAALAAHSLSGRRSGLGMSLFMSGGYCGFASGSLVAGTWVERNGQGLAGFWLLALPAFCIAFLVVLSGLHRLEEHMAPDATERAGAMPFGLVLALGVCIAMNVCILVRFTTILLVRRFPDAAAQSWGGATVFATGISGAVGSFLWGHLSERWGCGRVIVLAQLLALPFLYGLIHAATPAATPFWGLGVGLTMGGVFPLSVVLARRARRPARRLRMGLAIGGAWGAGEFGFILGGKYVGGFPGSNPAPVVTILNVCWILLLLTAILGTIISAAERRAAPLRSHE